MPGKEGLRGGVRPSLGHPSKYSWLNSAAAAELVKSPKRRNRVNKETAMKEESAAKRISR